MNEWFKVRHVFREDCSPSHSWHAAVGCDSSGEDHRPIISLFQKLLSVLIFCSPPFVIHYRIANLLNIRFDPIRYSLRGTKIWSNVHYQVPLLGEGWLSASGSFSANGDNAVNVLFDSFWWDASPQSLRSEDPHIQVLLYSEEVTFPKDPHRLLLVVLLSCPITHISDLSN